MKNIKKVYRPERVAMCEPGVTFGELIPEVEKEGIRLNLPLLPRKNKSVVGSMLEREPVIMPKYHWDICDPLACVEVIFGNGEMFRTGAAAGPGDIEKQWATGRSQKTPTGPGQISWHRLIQGAQGTMGIVTWASMRCELLPQVEKPFWVGSAQLQKIIELTHWLIRLRLVNECFIINNSNLATIVAKKWAEEYSSIKFALPTWMLFFNIAGYDYMPEERVNGQVKDMMEIAQRIGVEPMETIGGISAVEILKMIRKPCEEPYWKLRQKGACQDIFFLANYDKLSELIGAMNDMVDEAGYPASDMGIYLQPIVQGCNCHCEFNLFYDRDNPRELDRVKALSSRAVQHLAYHGAFFSRPYGENAGTIINRDAATVAALKKVKTILDPNNVMNPGKLCF
jgi:FAD/FMN-containing dehydrogenase